MIKFLFILILVLVVAVSGTLVLLEDPGYVLFSYADTTIETTVSMLIIIFVSVVIAWIIFIRIIKLTVFLPDHMYALGQRRRQERIRKYFHQGLCALAEGRWKKAEKLLMTSAKNDKLPWLSYLAAARAAQHMGSNEKRDYYLQLAVKSDSDAEFATELTQAELQLARGQQELALASLNQLVEKDPNNAFIMEMLLTVYQQLGEWSMLKERLPEFTKLGIINEDQADKLELEALLFITRNNVKQDGVTGLISNWESLTRKQKNNEVLVHEYAKQFLLLKEDDKAEQLLRDAIKHNWNTGLVYLYGRVKSGNPEQQLKLAESWVKSYSDDAVVNLSLGRICMHNRLWGKARIYLEKSNELGVRAETYFELGVLLEFLEDNEASMLCYRNGLKLAVNDINVQVQDFSKDSAGDVTNGIN
ncbi:MAG: hypothetical protein GXP13_04340 [Gammaproteobacteria bacterium]|nr:hypothetical protein [Gammaproteobacteria bacterium]